MLKLNNYTAGLRSSFNFTFPAVFCFIHFNADRIIKPFTIKICNQFYLIGLSKLCTVGIIKDRYFIAGIRFLRIIINVPSNSGPEEHEEKTNINRMNG